MEEQVLPNGRLPDPEMYLKSVELTSRQRRKIAHRQVGCWEVPGTRIRNQPPKEGRKTGDRVGR